MRVVQVVSVISPDNRYGGPSTVAFNQCRALAAAGHDVTLIAGARGYTGKRLPKEIDGVAVRLFPARQLIPGAGFAGVSAPSMFRQLGSLLTDADAVHVHLARDLLTLPVTALALRKGRRYVVQTHGMIDPSVRLLARPLDAVLTRRVLRGASVVFYLTSLEASALREVAGAGLRLCELPNGIAAATQTRERSAHGPVEVLYLARLHERKRPGAFVAAAQELAASYPNAVFRMIGPDEGEGPAVKSAIAEAGLGDRLRWEGATDPAGAQTAFNHADLYVLPSIDEPYPMSVLEAMRAGLPVIVTKSCGLARAIRQAGAGTVIGENEAELTPAVAHYLKDGSERLAAGKRAAELIGSAFTMRPIVETLLAAYAEEEVAPDEGAGP